MTTRLSTQRGRRNAASASRDNGSGPDGKAPGEGRRRARAMTSQAPNWLIGTLAVVIAVAVWWLISDLGLVSQIFLPSPSATVRSLYQMATTGPLWSDLAVSLARLGVGFGLAAVAGVALGLVMGWFRIVAAAARPFVAGGYTVPLLAVLPLFILWFGIGTSSKVALIAVGSFFPIVVNTEEGVRRTPEGLVLAAKNLGARNFALFRKVFLPNATPQILVGLRLGFGLGLLLIVAAEMLGGTSGIGYAVLEEGNIDNAPGVFALLVVFAALGIGSAVAIRFLERLLCPWAEVAQGRRRGSQRTTGRT